MPFTWILICIVIGLWFRKKNKFRRGKRLFIAAGIMTLFFSNSIIFDEFMRVWEVHGLTKESIEEPYDVGIVLGGAVVYNNDLKRISFRRGGDRVMKAVDLYRSDKIRNILITGSHGNLIDQGLREAEMLKEYLVESCLIPKEDIIIETKSMNTHENALFTKNLLDEEYPEYGKLLLITSGYHMRRSRACFHEVGMKVDVFTTDHYTGKRWFSLDRLFVPKVDVMQDWNVLTHEIFGYVVYWLKGYV